MRNFWNEIFVGCDVDVTDVGLCSYTVVGDIAVVVEGQKGVVAISSEEIIFDFQKKHLTICGTDLAVKQMSKGFAVVVGKIVKVEC